MLVQLQKVKKAGVKHKPDGAWWVNDKSIESVDPSGEQDDPDAIGQRQFISEVTLMSGRKQLVDGSVSDIAKLVKGGGR